MKADYLGIVLAVLNAGFAIWNIVGIRRNQKLLLQNLRHAQFIRDFYKADFTFEKSPAANRPSQSTERAQSLSASISGPEPVRSFPGLSGSAGSDNVDRPPTSRAAQGSCGSSAPGPGRISLTVQIRSLPGTPKRPTIAHRMLSAIRRLSRSGRRSPTKAESVAESDQSGSSSGKP